MARFILCCLGNPGERYDGTRHNLGFALGDALVARARGKWSRPRESFRWSHIRISGRDVVVVEPLTYMNLSGEALNDLAALEPVTPTDTLVVCDDIALPLGLIRLRKKGSDGGHNGLRSVIESLGTPRFPRLRLGVGPVPEAVDAADFVLESMSEEDHTGASSMLREAARCVDTILSDGMDTAMNRFNRRAGPDGDEE